VLEYCPRGRRHDGFGIPALGTGSKENRVTKKDILDYVAAALLCSRQSLPLLVPAATLFWP
jgi:hypothetical protein